MKNKRTWCVARIIGLGSLLGAAVLRAAYDAAAQQRRPGPSDSIEAGYFLKGQSIGTYREARSVRPDGQTETRIESDLVFNRLGSRLEIRSTSIYRETVDGRLTAADTEMSSSSQVTTVTARAGDSAIEVTTTAGGRSYKRSLPITQPLVGPNAARRLILSRLRSAGDAFSYMTFSPELGGIVTIKDTLAPHDPSAAEGALGIKVLQEFSGVPGISTLWLDPDGWLIRQITPSPLGDIEAVRAGIQSPSMGVARSLPSEGFIQTVVKSNVRLPQERTIQSITLRLTLKHPESGWPDFSADNQTILKKTPGVLILRVDRPTPPPDSGRAQPDAVLQECLAPNALIQSDDTGIRHIVDTVVRPGEPAWNKVCALQRWTNENMHLDMGIAIAPASEVVRHRGGTCFAYSMLLSSLIRSAGIPDRVRVGFVYAGGIWGGHAWVEARIGDRWIPVDGALYHPGAADAARFSVFTSSLNSGSVGNLGGLGQLFGNVNIKILDFTVNGRQVQVPDSARPYEIHGNSYSNPWLGLSVNKPSGFAFRDTDLTWPHTAVVAMEGPGKRRIEVDDESVSLPASAADSLKRLRQTGVTGAVSARRFGAGRVLFAADRSKAAALVETTGSAWLVKASGSGASRLVEKTLASMRFGR